MLIHICVLISVIHLSVCDNHTYHVEENNTAPVIEVKFVSASTGNKVRIPEDTKLGSFIAYVIVSDQDVGPNGDVGCDLRNDFFQLENLGTKKYKVVLKSPLDRETAPSHNITVTCKDIGLPPLESVYRFSIQVTDVNDVKPKFSQKEFKFWIHENQRSNFPVGFINVTDSDSGLGRKLTYSLVTNNDQFIPFRISNKGFISTLLSLDHEDIEIYKFQVLVEDYGIPPLNNTANVLVEVLDLNDNVPFFIFPKVNPYNMEVFFHPHHTKNITQIKATDSDSQDNAFLRYRIIRGNDEHLFAINQYTGLLSSTHVLSNLDAGSYELEFQVKDSGNPVLSARTTIHLTLAASNETLPTHGGIADNLEMHIVISIVIVAVTLSVGLTVFLSVCVIHHYDEKRRRRKRRRSYIDRFATDQDLMEYPPHPGNPQNIPIIVLPNDSDSSTKDSGDERERTPPEFTKIFRPSSERSSQSLCSEGNLTPVKEIEEGTVAEEPDAVFEESDTVAEEPDAVFEEPDTVVEEPDTAAEEPDSCTEDSESIPPTEQGHDQSEQTTTHDVGLQVSTESINLD